MKELKEMNFEEMKKEIEKFNAMKKAIKETKKTLSAKTDLTAEEKLQLKLISSTKGKKRELSEAIKPFIKRVFKLIVEFQDTILEEFENTKSEDKPDGQKWLTFKSDEGITFCVNRYLKTEEEEEEKEEE